MYPNQKFDRWGMDALRAEDYSPVLLKQRALLLALQFVAGDGLFARNRQSVCFALRDETPERSLVYIGTHRYEETYLTGLGFQPPFDIWFRATLEQEQLEVQPMHSGLSVLLPLSAEMALLDGQCCQAVGVVCSYLLATQKLPNDFDVSVSVQTDSYVVGTRHIVYYRHTGLNRYDGFQSNVDQAYSVSKDLIQFRALPVM